MNMKSICLAGTLLLVGLAGCSDETNPRVVTRLNIEAEPGSALPSSPLHDKVITSWINKQDGTMSTLFGNDAAVQYARTSSEKQYPARSGLSVVTWSQQEDPRWFGGNIPLKVKTVELITVIGPEKYLYQRYEGSPLKKVTMDVNSNDRAAYLLSQRAAVMP